MRFYLSLMFISLIILTSCSNNKEQANLTFNDDPIVTLGETKDVNLLSFEYRIINQTNKTIGPFYAKLHFHHDTVQEYLGVASYSSYELMGYEALMLKGGEKFMGGENITIEKLIIDVQQIKDIITSSNAIEIQLINETTNEVLASRWVTQFRYENLTE